MKKCGACTLCYSGIDCGRSEIFEGHISKTLPFLYGQVEIIVKRDGRPIDQHSGQVTTMLVEWLDVTGK